MAAQHNMVDPGYLSKRHPVRLKCEVCGINKDCVPCGNHRWCKRGRCPVCFPTILQLERSGKVPSLEKQLEIQKKIWDMEFWCETCNQFGKKAPILKDQLDFAEGQLAVKLDLYPGFYMAKDGTLFKEAEYRRLVEQKRPASAAQQQQKPAAAAAGRQGQRPASATQPQRPASGAKQQQQQQQQQRSAAPAKPAAAQQYKQPQQQKQAAAQQLQPAKAPAAQQQQQHQQKPQQQQKVPDPAQQQQKAPAASQQQQQLKPPQQRPAAAQEQPRPAAVPAQQQQQQRKPAQEQPQRQPKPSAAAAGQGPGKEKRLSDGGEPASKRLKTTAAATAGAALKPGAPQQQQQQQQQQHKAKAAAAAAAGGESSGQSSSEDEVSESSSEDIGAEAAAAAVPTRKPAAAGAGAAVAAGKAAPPAAKPRPPDKPAAATAAASAAAAGGSKVALTQVGKASAPAAAAAKAPPAAAAKQPAPQQQQQRPALAPRPSEGAVSKQQQQQKQQQPPTGKLAQTASVRPPAAAPKPAAATAGGGVNKQVAARKQQQSKAAIKPQQRLATAAAAECSSEEELSDSEEQSEGGSSEQPLGTDDIFGPGPADEQDTDTQGKAKQQHQQQQTALPNGQPAAAAAAEAEAAKPKGPRRKAFNLLDHFQDGAAAAADEFAAAVGTSADTNAAAAAAAEAKLAAARQAAAASAAARPSSALWPVKCKVEAAGPNFRYEFQARCKEGPNRSDVKVPTLLERQRDSTLRCMFWARETMLQCVQAEAGTNAQYDAIFHEPAPIVMTEFFLHQEQHLPAIVRYMMQSKSYMRAWTDNGSFFFGVLLRDNGHVVDFAAADIQRVKAEHLPDLVEPNELGLVMFKDVREEGTPAAYGRLIRDEDMDGQVSPRTPTWRVAQGASVYDDSWLYDTNLDNFFEQEVIDHVIAQGAFMHMDAAATMYGMNADMDVDMNEQSPYQQQQWQQVLAAGMSRALLPPAAAAAGGSGRLRMPQRPSGPGYQDFMPVGSPDHAITPSEGGSGSEQQQQQQQREQSMDVDGDTPRGGQSAAAAAAAAGFSATPAELQEEEQLDQQQLQQLSPVQQLLRGGRPAWPLMPSPETVMRVLRTKGLEGLVIYMDEGCFADYNKESAAGEATRSFVKRARQRGVTVYAPADPPELPELGTVHIVMVTKVHMEKCGLEVDACKGHLTEYLASGAVVVREQTIVNLIELPTGPELQLALNRDDIALVKDLKASFYRTGILLLLDVSLLLTAEVLEVHELLQQLHDLKSLMPEGGPGAATLVLAYCTQTNLEQVAGQKWGAEHRWNDYLRELTHGRGELCGILDKKYISSKAEPAGTHMLRNAHKVTYNYNNPRQFTPSRQAPVRYTVIVTADPATAALSQQQRESVVHLLDNNDGQHKTVIAATIKQTRHFLTVMREQLSS